MCPNKHGNSLTILNLSTSAWLSGTHFLNTFILQPSWAEVDQLNIVTEFPCLLGLTVLRFQSCANLLCLYGLKGWVRVSACSASRYLVPILQMRYIFKGLCKLDLGQRI